MVSMVSVIFQREILAEYSKIWWKTNLVPWLYKFTGEENTVIVTGSLNSEIFMDILKEHSLEDVQEGVLFQDDTAPANKLRKTAGFLISNGAQLSINWPSKARILIILRIFGLSEGECYEEMSQNFCRTRPICTPGIFPYSDRLFSKFVLFNSKSIENGCKK